MADLTEIQASQSIKIAGAGPTSGIETSWMGVDANGSAQHSLFNGSGTIADFNSGAIGSATLRVAAILANATGAVDYNAGVSGAQTIRVSANITRNGTELSYNAGTSDANTLRTASNLKREGNDLDYNFGAASGNSLRIAALIGNATGAALFGGGVTTAQVLRVVLATDQTAIPVTQSGTWTTGRTWTLASGTDSVSAVQSGTWNIGTLTSITNPVAVTQSTSPWVTKDQSDGPVTPGAVASFSQLMGGQFNTALPTLTNTQQAAIQLDASGRLLISPVLFVEDHNYGTVGASTLRTASQIGNATGAALFGAGTTTAQVLRVVLPTDQTAIPATQSGTWTVQPGNVQNTTAWLTQDAADGPVTPGTVAIKSMLTGGQFNTALPTLTNTQQSAIQLDASGRLIIRPLTATDVVSAAQSGTWTTGRTWTLASGTDSIASVQSGIWTVQQGTPPWSIGGNVASGAADSGNPVKIGGVFNTTQPTVTNAQRIDLQSTARGAVIVATGVDPFNINNITGTVSLPTGAATAANQATEITSLQLIDNAVGSVGAGTAGTNSWLIGGVFNTALPTLTNGQQAAIQLDSSGRLILSPTTTLTVGVADKTTFTYGTTTQLVTGGVFQDTTPTLTAGQSGAHRLNTNRAQHVTLRDPTTDVGITSSSNGNAGNQPLHVATPDTTTATAALGALAATVSVALAGCTSVGFQIAAGTLVGTLVAECSVDGGTTWVSCTFFDPVNSTVATSIVFGSANTLKVVSVLPIGGASNARVRVSAYTSGTANSLMRASQVAGAAGAITAAAFGTVTNSYISLTANATTSLLAANANRKYAYISNNSGGLITIQFGSATGLTTTARGLVIPNGNFYELKGDNLYTGAVFAFTNASGLVIAVTEGTP